MNNVLRELLKAKAAARADQHIQVKAGTIYGTWAEVGPGERDNPELQRFVDELRANSLVVEVLDSAPPVNVIAFFVAKADATISKYRRYRVGRHYVVYRRLWKADL